MKLKIDPALNADTEELRRLAKAGKLKRYTGHDYGMHGNLVKVFKPILDDADRPTGRVEMSPWLPSEGRFSWFTSDPLESELEPVKPEDIIDAKGGHHETE